MEKWECNFQMDYPGASAVPSVGFSATFGSFLGILCRKVSEWLMKRRQEAEPGCERILWWQHRQWPRWVPGELLCAFCWAHFSSNTLRCTMGSRGLSLLLEQAVTSKLRYFSSCYRHFQALLCQASLPSTWPGHLYALTIPVLRNGICGLLAMLDYSSSSVTLLLHFHKHFKPA